MINDVLIVNIYIWIGNFILCIYRNIIIINLIYVKEMEENIVILMLFIKVVLLIYLFGYYYYYIFILVE